MLDNKINALNNEDKVSRKEERKSTRKKTRERKFKYESERQ